MSDTSPFNFRDGGNPHTHFTDEETEAQGGFKIQTQHPMTNIEETIIF